MTEKTQERKKVKIKSDLKYPLPESRVSFEKQLDLIKAYAVVSKNGQESVMYKNFTGIVEIHPTIISGNNEFFENVGIIKGVEGQRGKYLPTEKAIKLYNALRWKKEEEAKSILKELLFPIWFWSLTKQILDVRGSTTRDDLKGRLGYESNADPEKHNISLNVLIDFLLYAGLIKEDENNNLTYAHPEIIEEIPSEENQHKATEGVTPKPITEATEGVTPKPITKEEKVVTSSVITPLQLNLGIMLTPDMSEDQIRKTIRIIVDEWKKLSESGG